MGSNCAYCAGLVACPVHPSSMARCSLRRQLPKVGARCVNYARRDLCGGRSAMGVSTAIVTRVARVCFCLGLSGLCRTECSAMRVRHDNSSFGLFTPFIASHVDSKPRIVPWQFKLRPAILSSAAPALQSPPANASGSRYWQLQSLRAGVPVNARVYARVTDWKFPVAGSSRCPPSRSTGWTR